MERSSEPIARAPRVAAGALALLLAIGAAAPASGAPVYLRAEAGWDGVARRGGVVPLRVTVRLPEDAPAGPGDRPWRVVITPQGGPWNWELVLPVPLAPGRTRALDAALPLHGDDAALAVALLDADGVEWARTEQALALLPASARLGIAVGSEHGLRRVRDEHGTPVETTWIRLPLHELPAEPAAWLDIAQLRWDNARLQPAAPAAAAYRQWRAWTAGAAGEAALQGSSDANGPPSGPGWQAAAQQLGRAGVLPARSRVRLLAGVFVAMAALTAAARGSGTRGRADRRARAAWSTLALVLGTWVALGAPEHGGRAVRLDSRWETAGAGAPRHWEVCRVEGGTRRTAVAWPRGDAVLIGPAWLPRDPGPWELWWWMPGTGQPRWEIRAPRRGARGSWLGLAFPPDGAASPPVGALP